MHVHPLAVVPLLLNLLAVSSAIRAIEDDLDEEAPFDLERHLAFNATSMAEETRDEELPQPWKERLSKVRKLGSGSFGTVYHLRVTCDESEDQFASLKAMAKKTAAYKEVKNMRRMKGANYVISTVGKPDYVETEDTMYILMPFLNGGDLFDLMEKCVLTKGCRCGKGMCWDKLGPPYSNTYVLALFYQATLGVQEIHSKGLVHMDIKTENIMMNCVNNKCSAQVIDLGVAGPTGQCWPSGTPGYMAPAPKPVGDQPGLAQPIALAPIQFSLGLICRSVALGPEEVWKLFGSGQPQNDIFSLGVVLYQLVYGKQPPFFSDPHGDLTMQYDPAKDEVLPQGGPEQTELDRLVIGMLNPDFKSRIGTPEILQRLMGYMQTMPDFTSEVIEMVSLTPQARGEEPLPKCLWNWDRPLRDIGDQKFTREDCGDDSTERETKEKDSSNKACQCHVLRKGQIVQEHFNAPECL